VSDGRITCYTGCLHIGWSLSQPQQQQHPTAKDQAQPRWDAYIKGYISGAFSLPAIQGQSE